MPLTTLIETGELAAHLGDPTFVIVDCRSSLDDFTWGEREHAAGHIPGAVFAHLERDLSGPKTGQNGRHPLPDPAALAQTLGRFGIGRGVQVVVYDQDSGMYASRLWWMLKWLGHDAVAVLNGGFAKWIAERRATRSGVEQNDPREFRAAPRADMALDLAQVGALIGRRDWRLLDARAPERYRGDIEPVDKVAGRIPGAANHPFKSNLSAAGTFKSPAELRAQLMASLDGLAPNRVVCYCGSGVTACHNVLALEVAGLPGAKLYPGSWSEWCADDKRPIESGD